MRGPQRSRAGSPAEQRGPHAGSPRGVQDLGWGAIPAGVEAGNAQAPDRPVNLAVLDFGDSSFGRLASDTLSTNLKSEAELIAFDRDQSRVAARGASYSGSLNLSLYEARVLGADAVRCGGVPPRQPCVAKYRSRPRQSRAYRCARSAPP